MTVSLVGCLRQLLTLTLIAFRVLDGFFQVSGEIPRVTEYEKGIRRGLRYIKETGKWVTDELIQDERFLMCKLKGKLYLALCGALGMLIHRVLQAKVWSCSVNTWVKFINTLGRC